MLGPGDRRVARPWCHPVAESAESVNGMRDAELGGGPGRGIRRRAIARSTAPGHFTCRVFSQRSTPANGPLSKVARIVIAPRAERGTRTEAAQKVPQAKPEVA